MTDSAKDFAGLTVAVTTADERVVGTGWFITPTSVVTCDHVVRDTGFDGEISTIGVRGSSVLAVERHAAADLAVIRVEHANGSLSVNVSRDLEVGETVFSHGFERHYSIEKWSNGHPMDVGTLSSRSTARTVDGRTQHLAVVNGVSVDGGMSGAPVWTEARHGIVGVMARSDKEINAYIVPIDQLLDRWPEFEVLHRPRPTETITGDGLGPVDPAMNVVSAPGLPARRPPISAGIDARLVGRDDAMAELVWRVAQGQDVTVSTESKTHAVHGLGGIGKTALALEFCHQHRNRFSLIWWVNAETPEAISESYRQLAHTLRLPYQSDEHARLQVADHLRHRANWLAVFDNVPDRESLVAARPDTPNGQVIATSRNPHKWADPMALDPIDGAPATEWLLAAAGHPDAVSEIAAAEELAEQLDGLALALSMATSYISQTGCSITDYLGFYQSDELLNNPADVPSDYEASVFTAWSVSIDKLATTNPAAKRLLEYLAFCAPDAIPIRIFTPESLQLDPNDKPRSSAINDAIRGLVDYSLATREAGHLWVHRLVQTTTRHYLIISERP